MFNKILKTGRLKIWALEKDLLRREHKLTYLFWECTLNCNFFCQHCGSNAGHKIFNDELKTEEIKKVFTDIAARYNPKEIMIAITGGEPLLRKDLFEVMTHASSLGFPWGMVTNGFLVTPEVVEKLKKSGMKTVVVSIDGIGEVHDKFRNTPNAYKHAINAVKLLAKGKFLDDLQITTSANKTNINDMEEMHKVFLPLGITSWRIMNIDPIGRAENNKDILLNPQELKKLLDFIRTKRKTAPIKITYGCAGFLGLDYEGDVRDWLFYCNTGINTASILHNGDIFVCPNVPRLKKYVQGNIRKDNFVDIWENKFEFFRDKERTACKKCKNCDFWDECLGNSFHLWDDKKQRPKTCHLEELS
jgi:radical SAM protein with 4Fe4S-binding SPASM domain